jgi:archaellum biogenesis ATPase FlaH
MSAEEEPASVRCDTGTSGLNHILGGGFPPNALYLVQGDPGVGKTTLALQFLMAGARAGESCLTLHFQKQARNFLRLPVPTAGLWMALVFGTCELCPATYCGS